MKDYQQSPVSSVVTTMGSEAEARRLAHAAVTARLAACAQVEPIRSVYRWEGQVCEEPEYRVSFKTAPDRAAELARWLREHHPYELPQILLTQWGASPDYAGWVEAGTRPG